MAAECRTANKDDALRTRYLDLVSMAFVAALLTSNVVANKLVTLGPFVVAGATLLFPITYLFGDVLTEVYGYAVTRRVIWSGFALQAIAAGAIALAILMPAAIPAQGAAFNTALRTTPWIVLGSLVAYWCGEFVNSYVLARLKVATSGRWLWTRTISSTVIGQAVDTALFVGIAFGIGARLPLPVLWHLGWSVYVLKCAVEVLATPLTYAIVGALKGAEQKDHYDIATEFNPFRMGKVVQDAT